MNTYLQKLDRTASSLQAVALPGGSLTTPVFNNRDVGGTTNLDDLRMVIRRFQSENVISGVQFTSSDRFLIGFNYPADDPDETPYFDNGGVYGGPYINGISIDPSKPNDSLWPREGIPNNTPYMTWEGSSWMYFVGAPGIPEITDPTGDVHGVYPDYLIREFIFDPSNKYLTAGQTHIDITLSWETMSFAFLLSSAEFDGRNEAVHLIHFA